MPLVKQGRTIAEERKVVTALFCDLVGFTATSEAADPEDVDRMLEIFERRQAAPALAETDALLEQATALSS